jgi:hypothetical protein
MTRDWYKSESVSRLRHASPWYAGCSTGFVFLGYADLRDCLPPCLELVDVLRQAFFISKL